MKRHSGPILLVGSSSDCADLTWLTGFMVTDPVVLLVDGRRRWLVVPPLERGRAARTARGATVWTPEALSVRGRDRRRMEGWALGLLRKLGLRQVTVPATLAVGVARRLERAGVRVRIASSPLFPRRQVKTAAEVARIQEAQQAAVIAMRAAVSAIAASEPDAAGCLRLSGRPLDAEDVRALINRTLLEHQCISTEAIVACGEQAADPHERGHGPLRAGESIVMDIFPKHMEHGYWGDLTRTVVRGQATPALKRMYAAVRAAQMAALAEVKAGACTARVHSRVVDEFARRGYKTDLKAGRPTGFFHGTGHGVGLEIHERPAVGLAPGRLSAGNVITVEPGLYYPEIGGVRIEDTVVVTRSGWRYLAPCEKKLEI